MLLHTPPPLPAFHEAVPAISLFLFMAAHTPSFLLTFPSDLSSLLPKGCPSFLALEAMVSRLTAEPPGDDVMDVAMWVQTVGQTWESLRGEYPAATFLED